MKRMPHREKLILAGTLLLGLIPPAFMGWYVAQRHTEAEARLEQLEPRYARLLGLEAQKSEIEAALASAGEARTQYIYPASQDANQTGNVAQQKIRDIFSAAGLQVSSSQVLPAKEEKGFDRIPLSVRAEGDMLAMQSALAVLNSQLPLILINDLDVQVIGAFGNLDPKNVPRLSIAFGLSILRERS
ncbi:type II secretion system protein GspM [Acidovorax sp. GBBC 3334]|uniref:type II secretion system protein GspM n=1 Tax=Acidovorax sp. GBBC 3334 TaxID=2940496 RepID=UPI0023033657|nr:type II secretion system protein GspM [Acidovorax sp. GBBC 3334]MDA8453512.1 type II secretion system protein GspM [Acidovorax sp. GBBC 3334]